MQLKPEGMPKITITCPGCGAKLAVPDMPGIQDKLISCPKCHFKAQISVFMGGAAALGGQGADDQATQLPSFPSQTSQDQDPGRLLCLPDGPEYQLKMGHNVGRI